jgi:hypothetical protein
VRSLNPVNLVNLVNPVNLLNLVNLGNPVNPVNLVNPGMVHSKGPMPRRRGRLSWVFAGWLLCQFVGISSPILFAAKTAVEEVCACPDAEEGAACPMHQAKDSAPAGNTLKNACTPTDTAFLALMSATAVVPQAFTLALAESVSQDVAIRASQFSSIVLTSDSPPPRT